MTPRHIDRRSLRQKREQERREAAMWTTFWATSTVFLGVSLLWALLSGAA
jgi:hypothetical protein